MAGPSAHRRGPDDILGLAQAQHRRQGLGLVKGDAREIVPGIACYLGGKHTWQSRFATVTTASGLVVPASDNVCLNGNLEKHVPIAVTLDPESNLKTQDRMKQMAAGPKLIITGHGPAVIGPSPKAPQVVRITDADNAPSSP